MCDKMASLKGLKDAGGEDTPSTIYQPSPAQKGIYEGFDTPQTFGSSSRQAETTASATECDERAIDSGNSGSGLLDLSSPDELHQSSGSLDAAQVGKLLPPDVLISTSVESPMWTPTDSVRSSSLSFTPISSLNFSGKDCSEHQRPSLIRRRSGGLTPTWERKVTAGSAQEIIHRFESLQSETFKEYRCWKETKWGEDNLDEVQFEDDDVNLELSLPNVFSFQKLPTIPEFAENLYERGLASMLAFCDLLLSIKYYTCRPREFATAAASAVSLWLPKPPAWLTESFMSEVALYTSTDNKDVGTLLKKWSEEDELMDERNNPSGDGSFLKGLKKSIAVIRVTLYATSAACASFAMIVILVTLNFISAQCKTGYGVISKVVRRVHRAKAADTGG